MAYDAPWKQCIARYFRPFLEFFFPDIAREIEWKAGYKLLDTQLRRIAGSRSRNRHADLLIQVTRKRGGKGLVLVHIEIQSQEDVQFDHRMFTYHYRAHDRQHAPLCSLAILGDTSPTWRPDHYQHELWGCKLRLDFPCVKLLDLRHQLPELERSTNPFGLLTAAHLHAQATRPDSARRRVVKLRLLRGLYERGATREEILELFDLIDQILELSRDNHLQFSRDLADYEQEVGMAYINSIKRVAIEEGLRQGREEGRELGRQEGRQEGRQVGREEGLAALRVAVLAIIASRFGPPPSSLANRIEQTSDPAQLQKAAVAAASEPSLAAFLEAL